LVFLPGEREIKDTAEALRKLEGSRPGDHFEVVPLYARLSGAEQHKIFEAHTRRSVVLATNVAETSLTVPGIRYVIDAGLARISRFSYRTKVQRLPIEPISQASAQQRSGRCGRMEAGIALRLYSEEDFEGRPEFTDPEILRTNLASVILQMSALGLGDLTRFPFIDPPDRRNITAGVQLLEELGALETGRDGKGSRLTALGRQLVAMPVDPRVARMVVEADRVGVLREVLVIAAALSSQDPRERPAEHQARADQLHARFKHPRSDFLTLLNLWFYVRKQQKELSSSAFRRMCRDEHLNYLRIREWQELESQLRQVAKQLRFDVRASSTQIEQVNEDAVHQALLCGLLSHIGLRDPDKRDYIGARNARFSIFPGSGLFRKQPQFVVAAELVETSRLYARINAEISPEWAEKLGAHLVKRTYSEPHWSKKRASVMAYERVTLYGVPLATDRAVAYGSVDAALARELFIRHALVYGEWDTRHRFFHHNRDLLAEAEELEQRARRRDIVVDEHTLFDFYDARIPDSVTSGAHFDSWWKRERQRRKELLTFDPAMLVRSEAAAETERDFPQSWHEGPLTFDLAYHFEPGAPDDGVRIDLPVETLNQIDESAFSWQVPGLREDLVIALIRSLPKSLRVNFVPAPNHARVFLESVSPGEESLLDALERHLRATTGVFVPREAWDWSKVPDHLKPTYRVVDAAGKPVSSGKDLTALKAPLAGEFADALASVAADRTATGQRDWTFGRIEREFVQARAGHEVRGFPALVDEGSTVGVAVFGSASEQRASHRRGVRRLLALQLPDRTKQIADALATSDKLILVSAPDPSLTDTLTDCRLAAIDHLIGDDRDLPWDEEAFTVLRARISDGVEPATRQVVAEVVGVLALWRAVDKSLSGSVELVLLPAVTDMRSQVARLIRRGFIGEIGFDRLRHVRRYLQGVLTRRQKLDAGVGADRALMDKLRSLEEAYLHRVEAMPDGRVPTEELERVRWLLEEYRVSLWAQQLGTAEPVSDARIRKALASV
jgi:ATP-dependent helicase HrpA